ncbi:MAG: hypothetical protein NDJ89_09615 [Oligoflexia bacterium]|nr:hypothetical protein [Oligoflexia bacterium]
MAKWDSSGTYERPPQKLVRASRSVRWSFKAVPTGEKAPGNNVRTVSDVNVDAIYPDPDPDSKYVEFPQRVPLNVNPFRGTGKSNERRWDTHKPVDYLRNHIKAARTALKDHIQVLRNVGFEVELEKYFIPNPDNYNSMSRRSGSMSYWDTIRALRRWLRGIESDASLVADLLNHKDDEIREAVEKGVIEFELLNYPIKFNYTGPLEIERWTRGDYRPYITMGRFKPIGVTDDSVRRLLGKMPGPDGKTKVYPKTLVALMLSEVISAWPLKNSYKTQSFLTGEGASQTDANQWDLIRDSGVFPAEAMKLLRDWLRSENEKYQASVRAQGLFGDAGEGLKRFKKAIDTGTPIFVQVVKLVMTAMEVSLAIAAVAIVAPIAAGVVADLGLSGGVATAVTGAATDTASNLIMGKPVDVAGIGQNVLGAGAGDAVGAIANATGVSNVVGAGSPAIEGGKEMLNLGGGISLDTSGLFNSVAPSLPSATDIFGAPTVAAFSTIASNVSIAPSSPAPGTAVSPVAAALDTVVSAPTTVKAGVPLLVAALVAGYFIFGKKV